VKSLSIKPTRLISALIIGALVINIGCRSEGQIAPMNAQDVQEGSESGHLDLYFIADTGRTCFLEKVTRDIGKGSADPVNAINELIKGPERESGLLPVLPFQTRVNALTVENGVCTIDFSKELITCADEMKHGAVYEMLALGAIANTLTSLPGIESVQMRIEGMQSGTIESHNIEELWGNYRLPSSLYRNESIIGNRTSSPPKWMMIDRIALAEAYGWREITKGNTSSNKIAFTFDGGGGIRGAGTILDALKRHGVNSTFFLTGQFIHDYPQVVKRIIEDGHEIGSHSFSHPDFARTGESLKDQLEATEAILKEHSPYNLKPYFRFPYGSRNQSLLAQLRSCGYISIYWTVDTLGWEDGASPENVYNRAKGAISPGAIVLMHLDSTADAQALSWLLDDLATLGYQAVTLSELLATNN